MLGSSLALAEESDAEQCDVKRCYIRITQDGFFPQKMIVSPDTTVVWKNIDVQVHMITGGSSDEPSLFDSSLIASGDTYEFTFKHGDSYKYHDQALAKVVGEIIVEPHSTVPIVEPVKIDFTDPHSGIHDISMLRGGDVTEVKIYPELRKLLIGVDTPTFDVLRIAIDRDLVDARNFGGKDAPFNVWVDGRLQDANEIHTTPEERILQVPIPSGTKSIWIEGTRASTDLLGYKEALTSINDAARLVANYKGQGIVVNDAEDVLLQAQTAFNFGRYSFAKSLADEAAGLADAANHAAFIVKQVVEDTEASINTNKNMGVDVSDAEEMLVQTKQMYVLGGYDEALNIGMQAKKAADEAIGQIYTIAGITGISSAWGAIYLHMRKNGRNVKNGTTNSQAAKASAETCTIHLDRIFEEKPHLRDDDRKALQYIVDKGGKALLAELRNNLNLPKSTAWRLAKRLEREELVEITKFGNQNLIKCTIEPS